MMRRFVIPLLFGGVGCAILISLGMWQVRRLEWKQAILAEIEARIAAPPVSLPGSPDPETDRYMPVIADGVIGPNGTGVPELHVLVSRKQIGAGFRVIAPFQIDSRVVMLDRGFVAADQKNVSRPPLEAVVTGNLHWPEDRTSATPENDLTANIWFARDIAQMADVLGAEPVLIIARSDTGQGVEPLPVAVEGIPNDHLQYAITWFSLAGVWAGMTAFLLWRMRQRPV